MSFEVRFVWEIEDFSQFSESSTQTVELRSPIFSASPNEITRNWQILLKMEDISQQKYGVFLHLVNKPRQEPISMKHFRFELTNYKNRIFFKRFSQEATNYEGCSSKGWKSSVPYNTLKERSLNFTKPIKFVCFMEFSRKTNSLSQYHSSKIGLNLFKQCKDQCFTDASILCRDVEMQVHQMILRSASQVFDSIFDSKAEEDSGSTNAPEIVVDDVLPEIFRDFLEFAYTGKVSLNYNKAKDLLEVAQNYKVIGLEDICFKEIEQNIKISNAVEILLIADQNERNFLKNNVMRFIKENITDVRNTPSWNDIMLHRADLIDGILSLFSI
ncbi:SPOPL.2 family protein [Megaselia abdita]